MFQEQMTQGLGVIDYILPTNAAAASYNSANPINMAQVKRAFYVIKIGAMGVSATFDARLQSCATSNFASNVHNIANSNITQVVNTANNTVVTIEVRSDQVTALNAGDIFVRLNTTVGTAAVFYDAVGLGGDSVQRPASQFKSNTVTQSVVVTP